MPFAKKFLMLAAVFFLWGRTPAVFAAYYDEVAVGAAEVFHAAEQVLKPYGIRKADFEKKVLETRWQEDTVERSRGLFKHILKQQYYRRWRMKISLHEREGGTEVQVKGVFEERATETGPSIPWKRVKTSGLDHQIEREIFFKILTRIETLRDLSETAPAPSPTPPSPPPAAPPS